MLVYQRVNLHFYPFFGGNVSATFDSRLVHASGFGLAHHCSLNGNVANLRITVTRCHKPNSDIHFRVNGCSSPPKIWYFIGNLTYPQIGKLRPPLPFASWNCSCCCASPEKDRFWPVSVCFFLHQSPLCCFCAKSRDVNICVEIYIYIYIYIYNIYIYNRM